MLYATKESSPYDLAVVQLQEPLSHVMVPQLTTIFLPGKIRVGVNNFMLTDSHVVLSFL